MRGAALRRRPLHFRPEAHRGRVTRMSWRPACGRLAPSRRSERSCCVNLAVLAAGALVLALSLGGAGAAAWLTGRSASRCWRRWWSRTSSSSSASAGIWSSPAGHGADGASRRGHAGGRCGRAVAPGPAGRHAGDGSAGGERQSDDGAAAGRPGRAGARGEAGVGRAARRRRRARGRQPAGGDRNYLELLRRRGVEPELVAAIEREALRIDTIVRSLLDYCAPPGRAEREPLDLGAGRGGARWSCCGRRACCER